ncbi:acyltransferase [Rhizobium sp. BE258]|uniref:acyltransferase family protein n=1 Tax=Rhizobium sp. BE258 TaxID=2817722 RepID=UPI00285952DE|nr:acyltransferase [Rhizobium sp. BE258]MDR7145327.1 peptidoglycan/LPS O-acetylase OafA/YrhL [Rhizobium sp. BE258]
MTKRSISAPLPDGEQNEGQFYALHLLRGVAAVLVMLLHLHGYLSNEPNFVASGHLAVDLFFLLSGYVIAYAYEGKLTAGLSYRSFIAARLVRLAPLYLLSVLFAALAVCVAILDYGFGAYSRLHLVATFAFSTLLIPTPPALSTFPDILFPQNGPAWSLFFELLVNLAYGAIGVQLSRRALIGVITLSGATLIAAAFWYGTLEGGATWLTYPAAVPRVVFSFSLGVFIFRYFRQPIIRSRWVLPILMLIMTTVVLVYDPGDRLRPFYNLAAVMIVWPATVALFATVRFGRLWTRISSSLGEASYGVYVMHTPVLNLVVAISEWMTRTKWAGHGLVFAACSLMAAISLSNFANALYDRPMRKVLAAAVFRSSRSHRSADIAGRQ